MPTCVIAAKSNVSSDDDMKSVNQDAPVTDDISGIGIDFSISTPTPDPLDTKTEVVSGDYLYKTSYEKSTLNWHNIYIFFLT